jgi:hypothetical protein
VAAVPCAQAGAISAKPEQSAVVAKNALYRLIF